jgi:hypothetical protein
MASRALNPREAFERVRNPLWRIVTLGTTPVEAARMQPDRILLQFYTAAGSDPIRVATESSFAYNDGILVPSTGAPLEYRYVAHGPIVGQSWYAVSSGVAARLIVIELVIDGAPDVIMGS